MSWVRIDDGFSNHPKLRKVGPLAGWLHVCGLNYCGRYLTDGLIPAEVVGTLASFEGIFVGVLTQGQLWKRRVRIDWLVDKLVEAGLWELAPEGYRIHDYADYNPSRARVLADRQAAKERMRRTRGGEEPPAHPLAPDSPEVRPNETRTSAAPNNGHTSASPSYSRPRPQPKPKPGGEKTKTPAATRPAPPGVGGVRGTTRTASRETLPVLEQIKAMYAARFDEKLSVSPFEVQDLNLLVKDRGADDVLSLFTGFLRMGTWLTRNGNGHGVGAFIKQIPSLVELRAGHRDRGAVMADQWEPRGG